MHHAASRLHAVAPRRARLLDGSRRATALAALTGAHPETLPHQGLRIDVRAVLTGRLSTAMIASLERMVEPGPSRRATSLVGALDALRGQEGPTLGAHPSYPPQAMLASYPPPLAPPQGADAREDEIVKSVRRLLWVLWGLGWILVPLLLGALHKQRAIPIVMFGSLAAIIVATWHKGALLRMALRRMTARRTDVEARVAVPAEAPRRRIDVRPAQVRVHTSDLQPDELVGRTELTPRAEDRHVRPPRA
ncbi:MAG: hypothetical protein BGO98_07750 [Myxococcales bacterium 68-20]|nr:MAG: hypothetical protein BGO98_07750 [Myxococcales bacterium 68-20]